MQLYLDLTESKIAMVSLRDGDQTIDELIGPTPLPLIDQLLTKHHLQLTDLEEVNANPGPGSFTGIKVAIAIANTLNMVLGKDKPIHPVYAATTAAPPH